MVLPDSNGVPRAPPYSGTNSKVAALSATCLSHSMEGLSIPLLLEQRFLTLVELCRTRTIGPTTPIQQRRQSITSYRFRLYPVRSPLLGVSRLISFPLATEMFHFTRSSAPAYLFSRHSVFFIQWFPYSEISGSQLDHSSPKLIAVLYVLHRTFHLGIHHVPLITSKTKLRVSVRACSRQVSKNSPPPEPIPKLLAYAL